MKEDFPSPRFGSEKSCKCLRPGSPDPFGRLGRLQPGLQRNSDPLQPGCEEPCNCVKPAKKDPFDRVRPGFQSPCSCHLPSGGHPAPFGSEKSGICLRPGSPDSFGRLGGLQPGLQNDSDPLQPGCEEPCNCVKPAEKDSFDQVKPGLVAVFLGYVIPRKLQNLLEKTPSSCHLHSEGNPEPPPDLGEPSDRPQTGKFPWKTALVISLLVAVLLGCVIPRQPQNLLETRKERSEMKGDLEEMMDDAKEAVGEFLDLTTGFLNSVASAVKQTAPGETTATRTYTETDENDEEDEEDEEDHMKEALTLDGLKKKGKKLVRLGKKVLDGSYEERIEPRSHKHQETDKRRSTGRKTAETVVSKDEDGQGFSAQRTTHTEKVYEMPEYMKEFYDDNDDKQRLGHKEDL